MWPIPTLDHNVVTISVSCDNLVLCTITKNIHTATPLHITAYERHELHNLELEKLILFNPTKIKNIIKAFLHTHQKENAFITISLAGSGISQEFISMPTSTAQAADFCIPFSSNLLWGYRFMYYNEQGQSIFYLYKITRSLLIQYQLLAISASLNLISVTTQLMALLACYKTIHGTAFRQTQFALDMIHHHNRIEDSFSIDNLKKIVSIPATLSFQKELPYLATACGLFNYQGFNL